MCARVYIYIYIYMRVYVCMHAYVCVRMHTYGHIHASQIRYTSFYSYTVCKNTLSYILGDNNTWNFSITLVVVMVRDIPIELQEVVVAHSIQDYTKALFNIVDNIGAKEFALIEKCKHILHRLTRSLSSVTDIHHPLTIPDLRILKV